jgi:hypothetical protein
MGYETLSRRQALWQAFPIQPNERISAAIFSPCRLPWRRQFALH